jgi:hypothetical protein
MDAGDVDIQIGRLSKGAAGLGTDRCHQKTRMVKAAYTKLGSVPSIHVIVTCYGLVWHGSYRASGTKLRIHSLGEGA